jgi:hypothetical protein
LRIVPVVSLLITVLRTSVVGTVAVAKSLLDDAGIDYFVRGETLRTYEGWDGPCA